MELLVVLSLIAVVLLFAIPSMQHLFLMNKTNVQVNQLVRLLNYSRNLAIIEEQSVVVCPIGELNDDCGKDWGKGINVFLQISNSKKILVKTLTSFTGAKLVWNRQANNIIFTETGLLSSQNGSFIYQLIENQTYIRHIILSSTGRVRVN